MVARRRALAGVRTRQPQRRQLAVDHGPEPAVRVRPGVNAGQFTEGDMPQLGLPVRGVALVVLPRDRQDLRIQRRERDTWGHRGIQGAGAHDAWRGQ